jgi:NAD(P)H-hydrate epimerase
METEITSQEILKEIYPKRKKSAHKGDFGYVLIVGGNKCFSGAPALAGLGALKAGSDLATIFAPKRAADIAASFSPSIITCPLSGDFLQPEHKEAILEFSSKYDAMLLGNGAGESEKTQKLFKQIIKATELPLVLDADGLKAAKGLGDKFKKREVILTPHKREFKTLTGKDLTAKEEIASTVKKEAEKLQATILLKGPKDIISNGEKIAFNKTGTPYMSKGGTGDVLAGICGSLLAREHEAYTVAKASAYISGKAGEIASKLLKESLMAEDVIRMIEKAINFDKDKKEE